MPTLPRFNRKPGTPHCAPVAQRIPHSSEVSSMTGIERSSPWRLFSATRRRSSPPPFPCRSTSHRQDACFSTSVGRSQAPPEVYVRTPSAPLYASPLILRSSSRRAFLLDEPIFLWIFRRWLRSVLAVILRRCEISSFESPSSTSSATRIS